MSNLTLVLLAAGNSTRFEMGVKKQWLRIEDEPLWLYVARNYENTNKFSEIIIVASDEDITFMHDYASFHFVQGGETRQRSLKNALEHVNTPYVMVSDIARACINEDFLTKIIAHRSEADCIVPYLRANDTIVYENQTIDRDKIKRVQTPQLSKTDVLKLALQTDLEFTDESSAIVAFGGTREFILGDEDAHKITFSEDLNKLPCLKAPSSDTFSGNGFDVHAFDTDGEMWLGGIKVESDFGFKAHSDGDVAIHSLIDALLGAAGMGDIGMMFPDSDVQYKGIDSKELLRKVVKKINNFGFVIVNVDLTIAAQQPRLSAYKDKMRETLAQVMQINKTKVNIKATTTEKLGFIGRSEGVGVWSNANLKYFNWKM
ncbi:MAG: bifunctional 2-C-methyl-D-erythritol 4-phosphate cytidylyltransferase/2-C-methyl-D-erythritol 2,4-cyclodiphosphate synthase [Campylobacterales bacterium]|nr:bifunctional 2-C-methyl-D-erythritol 4-phosphate cytidylyltransferase/2-C-methyl-D-erythritol 2,4-cyclodiphosphate synthase [Campylobacterales bacterium]